MVFAIKQGGGGRLLLVHINRIFQADRDLLAVSMMRLEIHNKDPQKKNQSCYNLIVGIAALQAAQHAPHRSPWSVHTEVNKKQKRWWCLSDCMFRAPAIQVLKSVLHNILL